MRFRSFHNRGHEKKRGSPWVKGVYNAAGIFLIIGGFLLSIPPAVPGFIVTIAGIRILVARSYFAATFFDALELSVRCVFGWGCVNS